MIVRFAFCALNENDICGVFFTVGGGGFVGGVGMHFGRLERWEGGGDIPFPCLSYIYIYRRGSLTTTCCQLLVGRRDGYSLLDPL